MVLERDDVIRRVQRRRLAERAMHQVRTHAGEIVVRETPVGGNEHAVAALGAFRARMQMPLDDLFDERLWLTGARAYFARARRGPVGKLAVREQPAAADDLLREGVAAAQEFVDRHRLARENAVEHGEIGGGQNADVVAILLIDALETLRDDQPYSRRQFGKRARFPRRSLAIALAGDRDLEAAVLHVEVADRFLAARFEADIRILAEPLVVGQHDRDGRDFVGRHVIAQRTGCHARHRLAGELRADAGGILRQIERATVQANQVFHGLLLATRHYTSGARRGEVSSWQRSRLGSRGLCPLSALNALSAFLREKPHQRRRARAQLLAMLVDDHQLAHGPRIGQRRSIAISSVPR